MPGLRACTIVVSLLVSVLSSIGLSGQTRPLPKEWTAWLDEVWPIMTEKERSVFKGLQIEEDRQRFQRIFWISRDPTPGTPQNEAMAEYFARKKYADARYGGVRTDRGRIYVLLGKPAEIQEYSGSEKVVDCELWLYRDEFERGLPPMFYLLFYRRNGMGDYVLFYPGLNSTLELLPMSYTQGIVSQDQAYRIVRSSFPELAKASLAVMPEEADSHLVGALNSSATIIARILDLPEREAEKGYLSFFSAVDGTIDVSHSSREVAASGSFWLTEQDGIRFLNYSLLPNELRLVKGPDGFFAAQLVFLVRVEDAAGRTIFQREKDAELRLDEAKAKAVWQRKIVFSDLFPIIEEDFNVSLTLTNKNTEEFAVVKGRFSAGPGAVPAVVGYDIKDIGSEAFSPLNLGRLRILSDPRSIFGPGETIQGVFISDKPHEIVLIPRDPALETLDITDISRQGGAVVFRKTLGDVKAGIYDLVIGGEGGEIFRTTLSVLAFDVPKPIEFENAARSPTREDHLFVLGQEYLNAGNPARALKCFRDLPERFWNAGSIPILARARYLTKDYAGVLELLERDGVDRTYTVLLLLGNSCLQLKKLDRAAAYFEQLRTYGDTPENNRTLGAIYLSLGDKEKAKTYWDRAAALEKERKGGKPVEKKEPSRRP